MCATITLWQPRGCEPSVEGAARIPAFRVDASGPAGSASCHVSLDCGGHRTVGARLRGHAGCADADGSASASLHAQQESKRKTAREFVAARRKAGDREIVFVDGLEMLSRSQGSGLVDGVHPNSLGFQRFADGLEPQLRRALKLPSKRR